jgi:ubiquinone/menaquinone biosynthesis C-methylase UbiE
VQHDENYAAQISNDLYHELRTNFVIRLFPTKVESVVDFGCGEGFFSEIMLRNKLAKDIVAIDPSDNLIKIARANPALNQNNNCKIVHGGVGSLKEIKDVSRDLVVALNVLAYMTRLEEELFYKECFRILKPGGHLLVTHSNELFDMFTMNNLTVDFFKSEFGVDIGSCIDLKNVEPIETYAIRENPLSYSLKLKSFGFDQQNIDFFHHHSVLPRMAETSIRNLVTPEFEKREKNEMGDWKEYFMSSTFGVLASKKDDLS